MTRDLTPLYISDLSAFAKSLRQEWSEATAVPGHLALLGMISRAAGFANYQAVKAEADTAPRPASRDLDRALRVFDAQGRMLHWPSATKIQGLCLWAFWARIAPRATLTEGQINDVLKSGHLFGDHVLLRRSLIDHKLVSRTPDGRAYCRIEQAPSPDARGLISAIKDRVA